MAIGDLLGEDGIMSDLVPIDLLLVRYVWSRRGWRERPLTSLRFFCRSIAKRNLVMALSLLEDIVATLEIAGLDTAGLRYLPRRRR